MKNATYVDVREVFSSCRSRNRRPKIIVRDDWGRLIEEIQAMPNGSFNTKAGIVRGGDLGTYILRISAHRSTTTGRMRP